ncbi:MAG: YtxH domain-containing protein [Coriobacteriia bacterium]|jgi:gas vesicle protein|nr:YtxH domain-containing protein [Coriobacteriia bacterium]
MRRSEWFFIGALTGLIVGVLMGILIAPDSGARTRRRLAAEARHAAELARNIADRAERMAEGLGGRVDRYLGRDEEVAWRKVQELREGVQRYTRAQASN